MDNVKLFNDDLRLVLPSLDMRFDLICADLPFKKTRNPWDVLIPFDEVWEAFSHVSHDRTVFAMNAVQPFTSSLLLSKSEWFRYEIIWAKNSGTDFLNAKKKPLNAHESILVFSKKPGTYNPQKTTGHARKVSTAAHKRNSRKTTNYGEHGLTGYDSTERYPTTVWKIASDKQKSSLHPTQKPLALLDRLILSYTKEGAAVLDPCMGSGTTGVSAVMNNRGFVGIEKDTEFGYFDSAKKRIEEAMNKKS